MSSNRHKTTMCNLCGKVMRGDNLKKHKIKKHSNSDTSLHHAEVHQPIADIVIDNQHNDEVKAKDSEIEELDHTPLHKDTNLKFNNFALIVKKMMKLINFFLRLQ